MNIDDKEIKKYIAEANAILKNAYVKYSKFPVGAVIVDDKGNIHKGVNVENSSYGLTICAERNAATTAITEGMKKIKYLIVTGETKTPISPCGACRQFISEFANEDTRIVLANTTGDYKIVTMEELLPYAFKEEDMI